MRALTFLCLTLVFGKLSAQVIPEPVKPILPPAVQTLPELRPLPKLTEPLPAVVQQTTGQLAELSNALPPLLAITTADGQLLWREVEVEQGYRAIEREWLLLLEPAQWQSWQQRWPQLTLWLMSTETLDAIGLTMYRLRVPPQADSVAELSTLFDATLASSAGRNHLYQPQAAKSTTAATTVSLPLPAMCEEPVRLGMVDTAIAEQHPAFITSAAGRLQITQQRFLPEGIGLSVVHGTAVAGVLAARQDGLQPLLPELTLYNAAAFYPSSPYLQSATLAHIIQALNWLALQKVDVINMSLTGPDNPVLAAVIARLTEQQHLLVAAAGNEGPAGAARYPAAYPQVIAATAVDSDSQLYRWANQAEYVDFAALGVNVATLHPDGTLVTQSGTSLATPVVSAAVACLRARQPGLSKDQIIALLSQQARDAGQPGRDLQFGIGVLWPPLKAQRQ
ncbi:hypothetical protein GCM10009098_36410 [Rheinheimera aquimaris]|uniref:Peptidase S8/S53 domain-containing protein n=1 Tax=Rheinheimera aquimaris TaxID=412437 RepID=A0ABN1EEG2_9GAMM|nr:S8 family serine peptidase [Rheinheimera aquimaris]MCB5215508.1 S8 family serine peptidase [Rheinheimera aquimaris]